MTTTMTTRALRFLLVLGSIAPVAFAGGFGELLFSVPVGDAGVHYQGVGVAEMEAWGPSAIAIGPDGGTWIVDGVGGRILGFDPRGHRTATISTEGFAAGIVDIEVGSHAIFALDAASMEPRVLEIDFAGNLLAEHRLPSHLSLDHGLSGLRMGARGELLVELEAGAQLWELLDVGGVAHENAIPVQGQRVADRQYEIVPTELGGSRPNVGILKIGEGAVELRAAGTMGAMELLGVAADGSAVLLTESITIDDTIRVEQMVRRIDLEGRELGAILPQQLLFVPHSVCVGPDGNAYALVTKPDKVEVYRVLWSDARAVPVVSRPLISAESESDAITSCVSSSTMESTAWAFRNNSKSLTSTNISGSCTGRTKPRYLGSAGTYGSVSYDWGGFDSVSGWNSYMNSGYKAGDINTAGVESCSRGVDCSGFVSRCWQLTSKYGTSTLPNISNKLSSTSSLKKGDILNKAGSHVVLVDSITGSGVYAWEATTGGYDRVIYNYNTWSRYSSYLPRRYVNKCP